MLFFTIELNSNSSLVSKVPWIRRFFYEKDYYFLFCVKSSSLKTWLEKRKKVNFAEFHKKAYLKFTKQKQYERTKALWKTVKGDFHLYESKILELQTKFAQGPTSVMAHWQKTISSLKETKKERRRIQQHITVWW